MKRVLMSVASFVIKFAVVIVVIVTVITWPRTESGVTK